MTDIKLALKLNKCHKYITFKHTHNMTLLQAARTIEHVYAF